MSGCEGCFTSNRGQDEQFETIKAEAAKYAQQQQKTVAIYREGYEYRYCLAEVAIENGYLISEILSKYK